MKRWHSIALAVGVSIITMAYALNGNDLSKLGQEFARGRYIWLVPALGLGIIGLGFRALRWQTLLNNRIGLSHSFNILNVGYFFSVWLPLRLNEVARSYLVTRLTPPISMFTAISSIIVERLIDLLAVVVLVLLAISLGPVTPEIVAATRITAITALAGMGILAVFAVRRSLAHWFVNLVLRILPFLERLGVRSIADRLLDGIAPLASLSGISRLTLWSVMGWLFSVLEGFALFFVFYDNPNWMSALLMIAIASIAIALPAVPGSVGPFEAAVIMGLTIGGLVGGQNPPERAFAYAVLIHLLNSFMYAAWGIFGLAREHISVGEVVRSAHQLALRNKEKPITEPAEASTN